MLFGHFFFFFLNGQIAAISFLDTVKQKNRMDNYVKIILLQLFILICNIVNFNNLNPSNSSYVKSISRNISFCVVNSRMDFLNSTPERREHFRGYSRVLRCTCRTRQRKTKQNNVSKQKRRSPFIRNADTQHSQLDEFPLVKKNKKNTSVHIVVIILLSIIIIIAIMFVTRTTARTIIPRVALWSLFVFPFPLHRFISMSSPSLFFPRKFPKNKKTTKKGRLELVEK